MKWFHGFLQVLVFCWLASGSAQSIHASGQIVFSDDFSQGLDKWQSVRGNSEFWQIRDGQAIATIPDGSTITELIPKDEYWNPEWQNIEYQVNITPLVGVDRNISFGIEDVCNWYEAHFANHVVSLVRVTNCQVVFGITEHFTLETGQAYRVKIRFVAGLISLIIDNSLLIQVQDWSFNKNYGKVGLKAGTGDVFPVQMAFDNVVMRLIDTQILDVPLLKQTDPSWAEIEYDHASLWSDETTIGRWGCAITSMVMIMSYHGITKFPDGTLLTPQTLNDWLRSQPDGYLFDGLLNWLAVTRLTHQMSAVYQTPKLEYQAVPGDSMAPAQAEISQGRPVILQIDGHFLVARGQIDSDTDVLIHDPAYSFTHFSQHQQPLLSTRFFLPSQTDLRYFLLATDVPLEISISHQSSPEINQAITLQERMIDFFDPQHTTPIVSSWLIAKPAAGLYTITLSQTTFAPFSLNFFVYDQTGAVTDYSFSGEVGSEPISYTFQYEPGQPVKLTQSVRWHNFRAALRSVQKAGGFKDWPVYWLLDAMAWQAEQTKLISAGQVLRLLAIQLSTYRTWMTPDSYRYLSKYLNALGIQSQLGIILE